MNALFSRKIINMHFFQSQHTWPIVKGFHLLIMLLFASPFCAQDVEGMNKKELRLALSQSLRREDSLKNILTNLENNLSKSIENQNTLQTLLQKEKDYLRLCQQEKNDLNQQVNALRSANQNLTAKQIQLSDSISLLSQDIQQLMENIREVEPDNVYPASTPELFSPLKWTETYCEWAEAQKAEANEFTSDWDTTCKTYQIQLLQWNEPGLLADSIERIMLNWINDDISTFNDVAPWLKSLHDPEFAENLNITGEMIHLNNDYLLIILASESYAGGAHPNFENMTYLIDRKTGSRIKKGKLFLPNKMAEFKKVAGDTFFRQWQQNGLDLSDLEINRTSFYLPENYSLTPDGIFFSFGRYEIGPYVIGEPSFTIPLEICKKYLHPSYIEFMQSMDLGDD
jgi:Protein of unknown function (DUF3298)